MGIAKDIALAQIFGSGSGSGQPLATPDWNQNDETAPDYIKNRPFYTTDPVETELVNGTFAFVDSGQGFYMTQDITIELTEGKTYKVMFDGVEYETECQLLGSGESGTPYIGSIEIALGGTPSMPFLYTNFMLTNLTDAEHDITIKTTVAQVVQIPDKYISDTFRTVVDAGYPTKWTAEECQKYYDLFLQNKILKVNTKDYTIFSYVVSMFYAKSVGLQMVVIDSNNVFLFLNYNNTTGKYYWSKFKDNRNLYIVNYEESAVPSGNIVYGYLSAPYSNNSLEYVSKDAGKDEITKAFMFNGDKELIIASSTTDSTKKFKITVDDSGTLKATEV